jgi:hypothetical protein
MNSRQPPARQTGIIDPGTSGRRGTMPPVRVNSGDRPIREDPLIQLKKYDTVIIVRIIISSEANLVDI